MATILSKPNGYIYNYNRMILRSPILKTITLSPSSYHYYSVGNEYVQNLPTRDFFTTGVTGNYSIVAGHKMRKAYLLRSLPSGARQIWRDQNASAPDAGYIYYQGNYSPAMGQIGGSAYIRVPAYGFTIPSSYSNWKVNSVVVTTKDHGTVLTSGKASERKTNPNRYPVFAWDASTQILAADSSWRSKQQSFKVGVFNYAGFTGADPVNLYNQCQQDITINLQNTDACANNGASNAFPYWVSWPSGNVRYTDGGIINAPSNPHIQNHTMGAGFTQALNNIGSQFYITLIGGVGDSGQTSTSITGRDYPDFWFNDTNLPATFPRDWWICERYQITQVKITLMLGEE